MEKTAAKRKIGFYEKYIKRLLDIVLSGLALIALSPVMLVTALLVRIKLGRPVIFSQERPGKGEKVFKMYKFRSMNNARDAEGNLLPDKERITKLGRVLRNTSMDELPELVNIFKGDMSIVGPRPLLVKYLPLYNEEQHRRHEVRPGLTGLAQVMGRNCVSWEERFAIDVQYVESISFSTDAKVVFATIKTILSHEGIEEGGDQSVTMKEFEGSIK